MKHTGGSELKVSQSCMELYCAEAAVDTAASAGDETRFNVEFSHADYDSTKCSGLRANPIPTPIQNHRFLRATP